MLPDFTKPAFALAALSVIRIRDLDEGLVRELRSDYRCQLRYADQEGAVADVDVRVYFVGQAAGTSGPDVPVIVAFIDWSSQMNSCHAGACFELREGGHVTALGTVQAVATR